MYTLKHLNNVHCVVPIVCCLSEMDILSSFFFFQSQQMSISLDGMQAAVKRIVSHGCTPNSNNIVL